MVTRHFVRAPVLNVASRGSTFWRLKPEVHRWLIENVGEPDDRLRAMPRDVLMGTSQVEAVALVNGRGWKYIGLVDRETCVFIFQSQEKAALFRLFYS